VKKAINAVETFELTKYYRRGKKARFFRSFLGKRKRFAAVNKVSIKVKQGEIFGILGPNGAGKTTLLKLLAALILPSSGEALVNGYHTVTQEKMVRSSIGVINSEERSFYWRLSGRRNLEFFARLYNLNSKEIKRKIEEIAQLFGVQDILDTRFGEYSSGTKQKIAIMRGLLHNPKILIMDEPTQGLDPVSIHSLRLIIKEKIVREQDKTVILATQRLEEAKELCHRVAIIDKGLIRFCGTIPDFKIITGYNEALTQPSSLERLFIKFINSEEPC